MQCINLELLSYVLTFVASNIARYRPAPWKKVIEGSEELSSRMHQRTEDAYSHYIRGNQVLTYYLDKECSFLYNIKTILDFAICIFVSQGLVTAAQPARAVAEIASKHDKPVLAFWMGEISTKEGIEVLRRSMIPTYSSPSRVAKAAYALYFYSRFKKSLEDSSGKM
jgi:hypothetical protein